MLQNMMRKMLSSKKPKSGLEINVNPDMSLARWQSYQKIPQINEEDEEIILRNGRVQALPDSRQRKRIVSCPDAADLQLLYNTVDIALIDLKRICEEGEMFLQEDEHSVFSSDGEELILGEVEKEGEEVKRENLLIADICGSTTTLEDLSCRASHVVESISATFEADLVRAVEVVVGLPDGDQKMDLLHSLQYQLKILRDEVTATCHEVIFSLVMATAPL